MVSAAGMALSSAASSSRIVGDFPPSSSVTRFIVAAASRMMPSPTATEPVNEIFATSGLRTSSAPTTVPRPVTTLKTPLGSSAAFRASTITRVCSELISLDDDRTTSRYGRCQLEGDEQRVRVPSCDQTGNADRLQGNCRLAPAFSPRQLLKSLLGRCEGVDARLHNKPGEAGDPAVLLNHDSG